MAFLDKFFGKDAAKREKPKSKSELANDAIVKVKTQVQMMEKRETHLERQIEEILKSAKEAMRNKNKKRAMQFLKKKKMLEKQLDTTENKRMNLEGLILNLEDAQMNAEVVSGMKVGGNVLIKWEYFEFFFCKIKKHQKT